MPFPTDKQRHSIIGNTGSGKTQYALWTLSNRNFHVMPWVIYDYKTDENIAAIPGAIPIGLDQYPTGPGIYVVRPFPDEGPAVEAQMWAIWERGNTGVYVDEGYMVSKNNRAFRALLTQGRSKSIPMIVLTQRPVGIDRFVFTESEYFSVFRLNHRNDKKTVTDFVPIDLDADRLPDYHFHYYDVSANLVTPMKPCPDMDFILGTFQRRLSKRKSVI